MIVNDRPEYLFKMQGNEGVRIGLPLRVTELNCRYAAGLCFLTFFDGDCP